MLSVETSTNIIAVDESTLTVHRNEYFLKIIFYNTECLFKGTYLKESNKI